MDRTLACTLYFQKSAAGVLEVLRAETIQRESRILFSGNHYRIPQWPGISMDMNCSASLDSEDSKYINESAEDV